MLSSGSSHLPGWQDHLVEVGSSLEDIEAVPHGLDLLYDGQGSGCLNWNKAGNVKPLLPTYCFQILVPQLELDDLPLPVMEATVQDGLPLGTDHI